MDKAKTSLSKRLVAGVLSVLMLIGIVPVSAITAVAATDGHPDAVTITVKDENQQPVQNADVQFTIDSVKNGAGWKTGTKKTDAQGCVEVLLKADFVAEDATITASVSKDGFDLNDSTIVKAPITSADQNFDVPLISNTINDVTIEANQLTYNGKPQNLVTVTAQRGDKVTYRVDGEIRWEAKGENAGQYKVEVTVERAGKKPLEKTVFVTINKADFAVDVIPRSLAYNEKEQILVDVEGAKNIPADAPVRWYLDGLEYSTDIKDVPQAMTVGKHTVRLTAEVNDPNYNDVNIVKEIVIENGSLNLEGLTVEALDSVYQVDKHGVPVAQEVVKVTADAGYSYSLKYQLSDKDATGNTDVWVDQIPTVTEAGSYIVWVKAVKEGYNDSDVPVTPAAGAVAPYNVYVAKAEQESVAFKNYTPNETTTVLLNETDARKNVYDFSAEGGNVAESKIEYKIDNAAENATDTAKIATIDQNGLLTVHSEGAIKITATRKGNGNYKDAAAEHILVIQKTENLVSFADAKVSYVLGQNNGLVSSQQAAKAFADDNGAITYQIGKEHENYLRIGSNGELKIADYEKLAAAMDAAKNKTLTVTVTANKAEGKERIWDWGKFDYVYKTIYASDAASYDVVISFFAKPAKTYAIAEKANGNGWFGTKITVTAADPAVYEIAKECKTNAFGETAIFDDQGAGERYVYLRDIATGGITNKILLKGVKIDTLAPERKNMSINIQELNVVEKLGVKFGFYNPSVDIQFVVKDEVGAEESGLSYIEWFYTRDENATDTNLAQKTGTLPVKLVDGQYIATLTVTATQAEQFRGHIGFCAYDNADNRSEIVKENDVVIVVDTINPTMSAGFHVIDTENGMYETEQVGGVTRHYFNGDVEFVFTIDEANFFDDDVAISVTRDGEPYDVKVQWSQDAENAEKHYGKFPLKGDGDYVVSMVYKDQSDNVMCDAVTAEKVEKYTSEVITIDATSPVLEFKFDQGAQKTILTIKEHNFRAQDVVVTGTIQDINGNAVAGITADDIAKALHDESKWTSDGDVHTYETDQYANGIYHLEIGYKGFAGNEPQENKQANFLIDHDGPTKVQITYSKSILDTVLETVTLGFYRPDVKVTFTATDADAGVKSFTWSYTRQEGQSDVNRPTDDEEKIKTQVVPAVPDDTDKSKFTGEITLEATEAEQIRGYISVYATDKYDNTSDKVTDEGYVLVVDKIDPQRTVEYSKHSKMVGDRAYYNGDATISFIVTEANFFKEDFKVMVTKNGGTPYPVKPDWKDESVDVHVGTYTLSGDGDYVVSAEYMDRSQNKMEPYTSHPITIDTVDPVVNVRYTNEECVNILTDREGHSRKYFGDTQKAVITITEHNFNPDEVNFSITAKDVAGGTLNVDELIEKSAWSVDATGDVHTMTITYPGEANYAFDVSYSDLATNGAKPYETDYFTVDRTPPTNLTVSYSQSVLDTVLESLSFGFYNSKVTVTITAEDPVSGVHNFRYSYQNAPGVSGVNAGLTDQLIAASDIQYSENGKTATAVFEIPKKDLDSNHQFNGTVGFIASDRANNENVKRDSKRIVVDNIAPTAQVSYNEAVNVTGDVAYYNRDIQATVTVNEANFYADDVRVMVTKNGEEPFAVSPVWTDSSEDVHIGSFTLTGDGDYVVTIDYRDKSANAMVTYISGKMTVDTDIQAPEFTINGVAKTEEGGAYKGDATIAFTYQDQNFADQTVRLTRTRFDSVEDVTKEFIHVSNTDKGGSGSFTIPHEVENDGVYVLTVSMTDKANHTVESRMKFTINRYGSVYEYGDYLVSLIQDGGQFIKRAGQDQMAITEDLVITEYNVNQLLAGSLKIMITRDGQAIDAKYTTNPEIDSNVKAGENGWYRYVYTIAKENFAEDGTYRITLTSAYAATDSAKNESASIPENSVDSAGNQILDTISFTVDTTAPEIRNVVNLDRPIVNAQVLDVDYTIVDVGGLKSIEVIVNGNVVDTITEFGDNVFNYSGHFTIHESSDVQTVQIKVTDRAGNVTDTASENFSTGDLYVFHDTITVSTNFLVRWYANQPLFWGSIGALVVLAGAISFVIVYTRRKKKEDEQ